MRRDGSSLLNHSRQRPRGAALILALFMVTFLLMLAMGFLQEAINETEIASNAANLARAFYAAEAGLESAFQQLRGLVANSGGVVPDAQLDSIAAPALNAPDLSSRFTVTVSVQRGNPAGAPSYSTTLDTGAYRQLQATVTDYLVTSTAAYAAKNISTRLSQVVQYGQIPLFQFGIFYGRGVDLEISNGPSMTFQGRVHANGNIYLGPRDANSVTAFDAYLTAVGNIYRFTKNDPADRGAGLVRIKDAGGTYQTLNFDHTSSVGFSGSWTADQWKAQALSAYGGKVLDGAMGVPEIVPPLPGLFYNPSNPDVVAHQMIERGETGDSAGMRAAKLYYQAGLLILDGEPKVLDGGGNQVNTAWTLSSCQPGTVSPESFYDSRQQKTMQVTQVDIGKLDACGRMPSNGILYISQTQTANNDRGVRLVNGGTLPRGGLTVISDNPVYVKGDYNTNNKVPAALLADAFTMLSNAWNDSASADYVSNGTKAAAETTLNAAVAAGPNKESGLGSEPNGASNGGAHNLIRFLEDWGPNPDSGNVTVPFHFSGSLVALWHSQHAQGNFIAGNCWPTYTCYYSPPFRDWMYEPSFNTQQPPGTPYAVVMVRRQWLKM